MHPIVAIDGPSGSGKSTLARGLAVELGLPYVNTGLMYRALASAALADSVSVDDEEALVRLAHGLNFALDQGSPREIRVAGVPDGFALDAPEVEAVVSQVARHPRVRELMRELQRVIGRGGAVMEGRDIGTAVFPDATVKIFLWAPENVRAGRRAAERSGAPASIRRAVSRRDALDARTHPPVPAAGANVLDATELSAGEVLEQALRLVESAAGAPETWDP